MSEIILAVALSLERLLSFSTLLKMCIMCMQRGTASGRWEFGCGLHYLTVALGGAFWDALWLTVEFIWRAASGQFAGDFMLVTTLAILFFALTTLIGIFGLRANNFWIFLIYTIRTGLLTGVVITIAVFCFLKHEKRECSVLSGVLWIIDAVIYCFILFVDVNASMYLKVGDKEFYVQSNFVVATIQGPPPPVVLVTHQPM